jgi:hypothetical protein
MSGAPLVVIGLGVALGSDPPRERINRSPICRAPVRDRSNAASQRLNYLAVELELELLFLAGDRRED